MLISGKLFPKLVCNSIYTYIFCLHINFFFILNYFMFQKAMHLLFHLVPGHKYNVICVIYNKYYIIVESINIYISFVTALLANIRTININCAFT